MFEVELARKFRGRTFGDFKPKKEKNRKGQPAKARPPRYFADRNENTFLNLLVRLEFVFCNDLIDIFFLLQIPERFLSPNTEHRVDIHLITAEINGCSYVQPYFNFQGDPSDEKIPDKNPISVPFSVGDLQEHSEGIKKLL